MSNKYPGGFVSLGGAIQTYSNAFSGSNYLSAPNNAAFAFGTGDFTIEAWIYPTSSTSYRTIFTSRNTTDTTAVWFGLSSGTMFPVLFTASAIALSAIATPLNTWSHVALVRSSGVSSIYVNGVLGAFGADTTNYTQANCIIGYDTLSATYYWPGYISNFRIVKGTAVYTTNFSAPSAPLANISGTSILTCQSATIIDNSTANSGSGWTITNTGSVTASSVQPPFVSYNSQNLPSPALGSATPGVWTLSQALAAEVTRSWPMYDPYYKNVVLNLHGNGISTQNITFDSDASPNNFPSIVYGNPVPSTQTPFASSGSFTNGSVYCDGSSEFYTQSNAAFLFGTGDFTVECWINMAAGTSLLAYWRSFLSVATDGTSGGNGVTLYITDGSSGSSVAGEVALNVGSGTRIFGGTDIRGLGWVHVAATRSGTTVRLFVNGVQKSSATNSLNINTVDYGAAVGLSSSPNSNYFIGYVSNARVVKGTAVYTSNFTPSTTALTAISGTSWLTAQSPIDTTNNTFLDSSSNALTITRNGNTTQGSFSPYGNGWSNYFGATGSYLSIPYSSDFNLTGDFTVEFWVNPTYLPTTTSSGQTQGYCRLFSFGTFNAANSIGLEINSDFGGNVRTFYCWYNGSAYQLSANNAVTSNAWQHIAMVRSGTVISLYVNGVSTGFTITGASAAINTGQSLYVAVLQGYESTAAAQYLGYISNFSILKGSAKYTGSFTPSTAPLSVSATNQVLLTCASNRFFDANTTTTAKTVTANGTSSVQRFQPFLFNTSYTPSTIGGSGYFDGSGDYLAAGTTSSFNFMHNTSAVMTVEAWVYITSLPDYGFLYSNEYAGSSAYIGTSVFFDTAGYVYFYVMKGSGAVISTSTSSAVKKNCWNHIAVTYDYSIGTNAAKIYINGVLSGTGNVLSTASNSNASNTLKIGYDGNANLYPLFGYISDFKISNSIVYSSAFTPPTAPVSSTGAALLCSMQNGAIYDNAMMSNLETVSGSQSTFAVKKYGAGAIQCFGEGNGTTVNSKYLAQNVPSASLYALGTSDFTIELFVYLNSASLTRIFFDFRGSTETACPVLYTSIGVLYYYVAGNVITGPTLSTGIWYHLAVCRSNGSTRLFVNGSQVGSTYADTNNYVSGTTRTPIVGANAYSGGGNAVGWYAVDGYIDDFRITKGVARYVANFISPTSQLQDQ